jgi:hypothetical protein
MTLVTLSSTEQRLVNLALTFPCLADADWLKRKDQPAVELEHWLESSPAVTSGGEHAAKFVLGVWNSRRRKHKFDFHRACNVWDDAHLSAFVRWAKEPWYA